MSSSVSPMSWPQSLGRLVSSWLRLAAPPRQRSADDVARVVTLLAAMAALTTTLALPAAYVFAAYGRLQGALETSATLHAAEVVEMVRVNPAFWEFEGLHIRTPARDGRGAAPERRRVFAGDGHLVVEAGPEEALAWPLLAFRAPVRNGERMMGETEAARSVRAEAATALIVAAASALLGGLTFVALRIVPLRMLRRALARTAYLAAHDMLTGLPNRAIFGDRLSQAVALARRSGHTVAVLCLDLDRFKEVNDTLGHAAGDKLLREVTARLTACLRKSDTLARLGGDEFAIIQPQANQPSDAEGLARRIISAIAPPVDLDGQEVNVGVSIGIALATPGQEADLQQLMREADLALYQVKATGRGDLCFFSPEMNARLQERRTLEADLRAAIAKRDLRLHYQPQVDLATNRLIGAEALLRWERPGHGNVPPDRFIGLAEETGLIGQIGTWALHEACRVAATWPEHLGIAVNVSAVQFRLPGLYESVTSALETSGLAPSRLELEITEGVLMNDTEETLAMLHRLRALGLKIAMDDFGTGYSSLGYLQKFAFDKIKIDRSFIQNLGSNANSAAIVRAVVGITRSLGVRANAEGVESSDQAAALLAEGCGEVQGYFFGRPMPSEAFARLVAEG